MTIEPTWSDYYEAGEGRAPRDLLLQVLARFPQPGRAADVGCGAGIDTLAMLERGWRVYATDAEPEAIERLRRRAGAGVHAALLRSDVLPMEDVVLDPVQLLWASYSLFFCDPARFPAVWEKLRAAVEPGGRFAGQILGERDSWASVEGHTAMSREAARALFDGWEIEGFDEEENDGEACSGPKHWHLFHVIAKAPFI
jgi:tellurite methyltransferase